MAANGHDPTHLACKCLNIRIHAQPPKDTPPPVEAGFNAVYVGDEGIRIAHTEVTLRSRSKAVPLSSSPTAELTRYTTVTCLVCGLPTYRVSQRITPDLSTEEGPLLPTDDWVEKELCKSSTGWIEVFQGCLTDKEIAQAESSVMYSKLFHIVLPGGTPPSATEPSEDEHPHPINARGPSEQGGKHLPELPPLFLPPPFTPSHAVFSHFSAVATEQSQKLRDEAEEYIAQVTEQQVAEIRKAEAALKQEVNMVWSRFRDSLRLHELPAGPSNRRRSTSVSGHARISTSNQGTSASVRITSFVPTPTPSTKTSPSRAPMPSALSASLRTSGMHYPGHTSQANGNGNTSPSRQSPPSPSSDRGRASPGRSSTTRVHSLRSASTASSRTAALAIDAETSIREAHRREMNEEKDMATSFRYVMDLEAQMEQQRLQAEDEVASHPAVSTSEVAAESSATAAARGHSPRVHRSAIKHSATTEGVGSPKDNAKDEAKDGAGAEEHKGKGKRKVTFDVEPEVAVIDDEPTPTNPNEDAIFDMDNESEHSANTRVEAQPEPPKPTPPPTQNRVRSPPRPSHSRSSSGSGLPPHLSLLRPASLPAPSAMRPPQRHPTPPSNEAAERSRALREALVTVEAQRARAAVESPIEIAPDESYAPEEPADPREAELLRLVAASTPSHRSAWKKNSKAWQVFYNRRERRAGQVGPEPISEEGNYVLDDFDPQAGRRFNGVPDSDVTDEDGSEDDKWTSTNDHPIAQSVPIPIGPLSQHRQSFGVPQYQPKTSLSDRPGMLVPPLRNSTTSASLRRASYAGRDPGALDFTADGDDDDDEDVPSDPETGGKARQRALKILKARNEMPAAGMWRSLT
ncbi:hypothetical protein C8T65DRAFT_135304 [Cerioporus squamosus]|nr:hypothetical protein C8T65DRAFT_135304 [Cerioporus squamosus]